METNLQPHECFRLKTERERERDWSGCWIFVSL